MIKFNNRYYNIDHITEIYKCGTGYGDNKGYVCLNINGSQRSSDDKYKKEDLGKEVENLYCKIMEARIKRNETNI